MIYLFLIFLNWAQNNTLNFYILIGLLALILICLSNFFKARQLIKEFESDLEKLADNKKKAKQ